MTCAISGTVGAITAIVGATAAGVGAGYSIYSGNQQEAAQQQALKRQNTAQQQAQAAALSTQRQSEVAQAAANQQTPDTANILQRAANSGKGLSSTMLTGPGGVSTGSLDLGKSTLLGG